MACSCLPCPLCWASTGLPPRPLSPPNACGASWCPPLPPLFLSVPLGQGVTLHPGAEGLREVPPGREVQCCLSALGLATLTCPHRCSRSPEGPSLLRALELQFHPPGMLLPSLSPSLASPHPAEGLPPSSYVSNSPGLPHISTLFFFFLPGFHMVAQPPYLCICCAFI